MAGWDPSRRRKECMSVTTLAPMLELLEMDDLDKANRPDAVSGAQKLRWLYAHPGPYTTVYLARRPLMRDGEADTERRWGRLRKDLEAQCAPPEALAAIEARLALPAPPDTSAVAVLAAADGTTVVEHGQDAPRADLAVVDELPYAAPLLEWHQRRIPHLVVTIDDDGADIATFGPDHYTRIDSVDGQAADIAGPTLSLIDAVGAELVVVAGPRFATRRLAEDLAGAVSVSCRVVAEPDPESVDDLADAAVRHVADVAARATVGLLRELRYLASHHSAVDGTADTVAALREGRADVLLIHDDPVDQRRIWIGPEPTDLSLESRPGWADHGRLVDAAIRAAVVQGIAVHIIPSTGPQGPDDNTAALVREVRQSPA